MIARNGLLGMTCQWWRDRGVGRRTGLDVRAHGGAEAVGLVAVEESHLEAVVLIEETVHRSEHHLRRGRTGRREGGMEGGWVG